MVRDALIFNFHLCNFLNTILNVCGTTTSLWLRYVFKWTVSIFTLSLKKYWFPRVLITTPSQFLMGEVHGRTTSCAHVEFPYCNFLWENTWISRVQAISSVFRRSGGKRLDCDTKDQRERSLQLHRNREQSHRAGERSQENQQLRLHDDISKNGQVLNVRLLNSLSQDVKHKATKSRKKGTLQKTTSSLLHSQFPSIWKSWMEQISSSRNMST